MKTPLARVLPARRVGWVYTAQSHRGVLCSRAQLLTHNSSFYVPLFLPVSTLVSQKKGSGCHFASRLCGWKMGGEGGGGEMGGECSNTLLFVHSLFLSVYLFSQSATF